MVMLGCTPKGRLTEQHDIFFGISYSIKELIPQMNEFWPEANGDIHIDAWREVTSVDDYQVTVVPKVDRASSVNNLYFINLGGYRENEFEEYHYKILTVSGSLAEATQTAKQTAFYKHYGFKGATSHIDDKYGVDVDDMHKVADILSEKEKQQFSIQITPSEFTFKDELHIGYFKFSKFR